MNSSLNPTPFLQVHNLKVTFPNGNGGLHALGGVTFDLYPQEFLSVLGPSGSGKSTLLRVLAGLHQAYRRGGRFRIRRARWIGLPTGEPDALAHCVG